MDKLDLKPSLSTSLRRMRTHAEWNVDTHMIRARRPTRSSTRSFISAAALLVKVIASTDPGCALRSEISQAIRRVSTRVLPEPAPATTSSGAPSWTTAARWGSLSPSRSCSRVGPWRVGSGPSVAGVAGMPGRGIEMLMLPTSLRAGTPGAPIATDPGSGSAQATTVTIESIPLP